MRPLLALIPLLVAGCGSDLKALEDARALWVEKGSDTYTMTVAQNCFCPDTDPVDVDVVASAVREAVIQRPDGAVIVESAGFLPWYTIEGLFDEIQSAIESGAHAVDVEYADSLGYPKSIQVDVEQISADDEYGWTVSSIKLDPAGVGTGG